MKSTNKVPQKSFVQLFILTILMSGLALAGILWSRTSAAQGASQSLSLPLTSGASNALDLGAFAGGTTLNLTFSGNGDVVDSRLQVKPDGSLYAPASGGYDFANAGAAYSTQNGGDGINHFAGGGANFDSTGSGYPFAGKMTTDTTDPAAIRIGAVVGTFSATPARGDWFFIGNGSTVQVPASGAHLFIAVNDTVSGDNHGAYSGTLTVGNATPQAVSNGKIVFQRGFYSPSDKAAAFIIDPATGTDAALNQPDVFGRTTDSRFELSFSPDGKQIAYSSNGVLSLMNADGTNGRPVGYANGITVYGRAAAWSPDGAKLVYIGGRDDKDTAATDFRVLWTVNIDGSGRQKLTNFSYNLIYDSPSWGSNGKIAFGCLDRYPDYNICTINPDGSGKTAITNKGSDHSPKWSRDGTQIVFASGRGSTASFPPLKIYTMDGQGGNVKAITTGVSNDNYPAWSPDGKQIVFSSIPDGTYSSPRDLYVMNADGTGITKLNTSSTGGESPDWGTATAGSPTPTPTPTPTPSPSPSPSPTPAPTSSALSFEGLLRDKVGRGDANFNHDGQADGTFSVKLPAGTPNRTITQLELSGSNGSKWDTIPKNGVSLIGVGDGNNLDGSLFNDSDGSIRFDSGTGNGSTVNFRMYVSDTNPSAFVQGNTFTLKITFSDKSTFTDSTTIGGTPSSNAADIAVTLTAASNPVQVDAVERFTLTVQNFGPATAQNVKVRINVFGNVQDFSPECKITAPGSAQYICTYDLLAINTYRQSYFRTKPTAVSDDFSPVVVETTSAQTDPNPANNTNIRITNPKVTVVANSQPPANDKFTNAQDLPGLKGSINGNNIGATREDPVKFLGTTVFKTEPDHVTGFEATRSVWYHWASPDKSGTVRFNVQSNTFPALIGVYDFDPSNIAQGVNKVGQGFPLPMPFDYPNDIPNTIPVSFTYKANHIYFIAIDGIKKATGTFTLAYSATPVQPASAPIPQVISGIYPSAGSIKDVNPSVAGGFFQIHVKGANFTTDSRVTINGETPSGTTLDGRRTNANTQFVSSEELILNIPPVPFFNFSKKDRVDVITLVPSTSANTKYMHGTADIPAGTYALAANPREFSRVIVVSKIYAPGESAIICASHGYPDAVCINYTNTTNAPVRITPSIFSPTITAFPPCAGCGHGGIPIPGARTIVDHGVITSSDGFSFNTALALTGTLDASAHVDAPTGSNPVLMVQGGVVRLISQDGGGLISQDGGGLVASGGGNAISDNGAGLISQDGGGLISQDGGGLISQDGGGVISNDGGSFTGTNNFDFVNTLKNVVAPQSQTGDNAHTMTTADVQKSVGWFVVRSSGNTNPTYTATVDPIDGTTTGNLSVKFDNTSNPRISDLRGLAFAVALDPAILQLAQTNIAVNKDAGHATVTVKRTGPADGVAYIDYATISGTASDSKDYVPQAGTLSFAAGETSKSFDIPVINNNLGAKGDQKTVQVVLTNPYGAAFMMPNSALITITNTNAPSQTNPLDNTDARFFVRQQYLDFLNREPDQGGFDYWSSLITKCAASDAKCINGQRVSVSAAFFIEQEFQDTGSFVYRLYKGTLGRQPNYAEFTSDRSRVIGGTNLEASKQTFAENFTQQQEFLQKYPQTMTGTQFIDALLQTVKQTANVDLSSQRTALINDYTTNNSRARIIRAVVDATAFQAAEYNRAFVLMQYFGYLRRDPDTSGYNFWLDILNNRVPNNYRSMVCAFINSAEYQLRFSSVVSRTDKLCAQ